jgi:DnaJ-like protein
MRDSGALRGLPGEGAPLPSDPDADADDAWAARHVVRTSGATPLWADLRREIAHRRARLATRLRVHHEWLERRAALLAEVPADRIVGEAANTRAVDGRVQQEIAAALADLNALVRRHNLVAVTSVLHLPAVSAETLERLARTAVG